MELIRRFADLGYVYQEAYVSQYDPNRLKCDPGYGLCAFLYSWAFERAGAPRGYRIAAVKAVNLMIRSQGSPEDLPRLFSELYSGKANVRNNPVFDPKFPELDIPSIITDLEAGLIDQASYKLKIRGIGPKLKAFFLRDLVSIMRCEEKTFPHPEKLEPYLWCQPVDVWVRYAAEVLPDSQFHPKPPAASAFGLCRADLNAAWKLICMASEAKISPLALNQGIWYFCSNVVADSNRLRYLLSSAGKERFEAELALMEGFLPMRPSCGRNE